MKKLLWFVILASLVGCSNGQGNHLFILAGQSNMVGVKPQHSFTPIVEEKFGAENVIVVHSAKGAQPIRQWVQDANGAGSLYEILISKVLKAVSGKPLETVTLLWMQGERDAFESLAESYQESFNQIQAQLRNDLNIDRLYFVIGRLSDFDLENKRYKEWSKVRNILETIANNSPLGSWVNTDDLNDGINQNGDLVQNDLHYTELGYQIFGERLAEKAISLIQKHG